MSNTGINPQTGAIERPEPWDPMIDRKAPEERRPEGRAPAFVPKESWHTGWDGLETRESHPGG